MWTFSEIIGALSETDISALLKNSLHGIERECLRMNSAGQISRKSHPVALGSKLTHPFITTDFAECQLELVTNPSTNVKCTLLELQNITNFTYKNITNELLWPFSAPCWLPDVEEIPVAQYGVSNSGRYKTLYRQGLKVRYKNKMQMLSGIHYNFSFSEELWDVLFLKFGKNQERIEFKNKAYFAILRNFNRYHWLLIYLFGASPVLDKSYFEDKSNELIGFDKDNDYGKYATSLRMSKIGYSNDACCKYRISLNDLDSFISDLRTATQTQCPEFMKLGLKKDGHYIQINENILQIENEYYASMRPRQLSQSPEENLSDALKNRGVGYLEIRSSDVDPFSPVGMNDEQLQFIQLFLFYCLFKESPDIICNEQTEINENRDRVASQGRSTKCMLKNNNQSISLDEWGKQLLDNMNVVAALLDRETENTSNMHLLEKQKQKLHDKSLTPSAILLKKMKDSGKNYLEFGLSLAKQYRDFFINTKLDKKTEHEFNILAKKSLLDQKQLENTNRISFEKYLLNNK